MFLMAQMHIVVIHKYIHMHTYVVECVCEFYLFLQIMQNWLKKLHFFYFKYKKSYILKHLTSNS